LSDEVFEPDVRSGRVLDVHPRIRIPLRELRFTFVRSSGPGGQNVNKLATKAVVRWKLADSASLPEDVRQRFSARFAGRISADGLLIISSDRFRTQRQNQRDCLEKLKELLCLVAEQPIARRASRPTAAARRKRRANKELLSRKKQLRRQLPPE
jgi:ribosome-associated protein